MNGGTAVLRGRLLIFKSSYLLLAGAVIVGCLANTVAQVPPPTLPVVSGDLLGFQPYQSYHGADIDSINLATGLLSLNFPIVSYPQRGKLHLSFNLMYNQQPQHFGNLCIPPDPCQVTWSNPEDDDPFPTERGAVSVEWAQKVAMGGTNIPLSYTVGNTMYTSFYGNWWLQTVDGSKHILGSIGAPSWGPWNPTQRFQTTPGPFESLDATGWRANGAETSTSSTVPVVGTPTSIMGPDGTYYNYNGTVLEDSSGNFITRSSNNLVDSLGRTVPLPPTAASLSNTGLSVCAGGALPATKAVAWTPPGYSGTSYTFIYCYAVVTPNMDPNGQTNPGLVNGAIPSSTRLQTLILPNGQRWQFTYNDIDSQGNYYLGNPDTYGTLSQIILPTGGSITYAYTTMMGGLPKLCANGGRWIHSRTVTDQTGPHTWTYTYNGTQTIVRDPAGNDVVHTFTGDTGACNRFEIQTQYYNGSSDPSNLVKTISTTYNYSTASRNTYPNGYINLAPSTIVTQWPNGDTSQTKKSYDSGFSYYDYMGQQLDLSSHQNQGIYGRVTTSIDYDYGSGVPGGILRQTATSYEFQSYGSYLDSNLLDLPASVVTSNGAGYKCAQTDFGYDDSSRTFASGVSHHGLSPPGTVRGNLTAITRQLGSMPCQSGGTWTPVASYQNDGRQLEFPAGDN